MDETGQDDGGKNVFGAVRQGQFSEDHGDGAGGTADHPGTTTQNAGHQTHHKGGIEPGQWAESRDEGKGDGFRDERHGHGEPTENLEAVVDGLSEVEEGNPHIVGRWKKGAKLARVLRLTCTGYMMLM